MCTLFFLSCSSDHNAIVIDDKSLIDVDAVDRNDIDDAHNVVITFVLFFIVVACLFIIIIINVLIGAIDDIDDDLAAVADNRQISR